MNNEREDFNDQLIIGIDLGTTKSGMSMWDPEYKRPRMLTISDGDELMPSIVAWNREHRTWVVGKAARQLAVDQPADVVYSIKRCIGRWYTDRKVEEALPELTYRLVSGGGTDQLRDVVVNFGARPDSPDPHLLPAPAISAKVLEQLHRDAAVALDLPKLEVQHTVITVPAYFDILQRRATRLAGEMAGLKVVALLNEPTAAALAYGAAYGNEVIGRDWRRILVYDLGGGTFDISIVEARRFDAGYDVVTLGVDGDTRLGGDDIDAAVVSWLASEIEERSGWRVRPNDDHTQALLRLAAERAKIELSSVQTTTVKLRDLDLGRGPSDIEIELTRDQLESCAAGVLKRTQEIAQRAVDRVEDLTWDQIDQVIMVGGQTLMPAIQRSVEDVSGRKPRALDWPQQAVARGAAEYAHILSLTGQEAQDSVLSHVIALPLGIRIDENAFKPIVQANRTVPHRSEPLTVTTTEDGQMYIIVEILQQPWGAKTADECVLLGTIRMEVPPAPKGGYNFTVEFNVLEDGTMKVIVADPSQQRNKELDIIEQRTTTWRDAAKKRGG